MNFEAMQWDVHTLAKSKGWWDDKDVTCIPEKLCLIHSEISEALEEYRNGSDIHNQYYDGVTEKPEGFGIELADIIIRTLDLSEWLGINLAALVIEKHEYNKTRSWKHGNKLA